MKVTTHKKLNTELFRGQIKTAFLFLILSTILFGMIYPLLVFVIAQSAFSHKANASLIQINNKVIGSSLIGQEFQSPHYFWGRPSATHPSYNPLDSTGSNLCPANPVLLQQIKERVHLLTLNHPENSQPIPVDLVTASASGLDPHISIAAARYQAGRIAKSRKINEQEIYALIESVKEKQDLGILGEPRINVLLLNMQLDMRYPL